MVLATVTMDRGLPLAMGTHMRRLMMILENPIRILSTIRGTKRHVPMYMFVHIQIRSANIAVISNIIAGRIAMAIVDIAMSAVG